LGKVNTGRLRRKLCLPVTDQFHPQSAYLDRAYLSFKHSILSCQQKLIDALLRALELHPAMEKVDMWADQWRTRGLPGASLIEVSTTFKTRQAVILSLGANCNRNRLPLESVGGCRARLRLRKLDCRRPRARVDLEVSVLSDQSVQFCSIRLTRRVVSKTFLRISIRWPSVSSPLSTVSSIEEAASSRVTSPDTIRYMLL
jgi:hypothetical protein